MKHFSIIKYLPVLSILFLAACDLEQEVEIELPEYDSRPVVECYLEPDAPFQLLLTKSSPYFEAFPSLDDDFLSNLLLQEAEVSIKHNGITYPLENELRFDFFTGKLYNYSSTATVPYDTLNPFELMITLPEGETITGSTQLLPQIPIDSVVVEVAESDTLARILTYFNDNPDQENYYRRMLNLSSLDSIPEQDFAFTDRVFEGNVVLGTNFEYERGDTIYSALFHIDKNYHDFLQSIEAAVAGNGNPFAQPSPTANTLGGTADAIGIFTGLVYDRRMVIIDF